MITIWMTYFLAAVAASGIFIAAGWRSRHARNVAAAHGRAGLPFDPLWGEAEIDIDASDAHADVDAAIRLVLKRLARFWRADPCRPRSPAHPDCWCG